MEKEIKAYAVKHNMIAQGDGIAVGVSGGADSMCLLLFLMAIKDEYGLKLVTVHVNHGIRGASADRDEAYVMNFCLDHGVNFRAVHADIPRLAAETGCTEEEAGRNFRYETFVRICREEGLNKIAVAHNLEDNAETVLFNLMRGSNIAGMRGIAPVKERGGIQIIRPLLNTSRKDIERYLEERGVSYCTDETNLEEDYSRNRIRHRVLPYLKENINSGAVEHISAFASQAGEIEEFLRGLTEEELRRLKAAGEYTGTDAEIRVNAEALLTMKELLAKSVIRSVIGDLAGSLKDVEEKHALLVLELAAKGTGKQISLPYGITVRNVYGGLVFSRNAEAADGCIREAADGSGRVITGGCGTDGITVDPEGNGVYPLPDGKTVVKISVRNRCDCPSALKSDYTKWFDYDKIQGNLCIRNRREGDWMMIRPGGPDRDRPVRKLLKRYFMDEKVLREERERMFLLAEDSHILWAIGKRRDDSYLVTDETEKVLEVTVSYGG